MGSMIGMPTFYDIETKAISTIDDIFSNLDSLELEDTEEIKKRLEEIKNIDSLKHYVHIGKNIDDLENHESGARFSKNFGYLFALATAASYLIGDNAITNYNSIKLSIALGTLALFSFLGYFINKSDRRGTEKNIGDGLAYVFGEKTIQSETGYEKGLQTVENIYSHLMGRINQYPLDF